jgi:CRISPR-associated protein Csx10
MIGITYKLILEEPLLATSLNGDPNSSVSYPFIPGSMIRGLVAGRMDNIDSMTTDVRSLLFDGRTRFLNAYLADAQWERGLPVPLSWMKEKDRMTEAGLIQDHAWMEPEFETPKSAGAGFNWVHEDDEGALASLRNPHRQIAVHTLRHRGAGRPTKQEGAVYQYDALAPGEGFVGVILVEDDALARTILELLPEGDYRLGGSATAGYGLITLNDVQRHSSWQEYIGSPASISQGKVFTITLLSDAILRDAYGSNHSRLEDALGAKVSVVGAFKKTTPVGGFNRTWGLPLPQEMALSAGSVFVLKALEEISEAKVAEWLEQGVGERRIDGFGRLAVNWPDEDEVRQIQATSSVIPNKPGQLDEVARRLAERMTIRKRKKELDVALVQAINSASIKNPPPNSQLSRLRIIARSALQERDLSRISRLMKRKLIADDGEHVDNPDAMKNNSLKKFESARFKPGGGENMPLSQWLIELADEPTRAWRYLGGEHPVSLGDVQAPSWIAEEYAVRLIDGVFAKTLAKKRSKGGA